MRWIILFVAIALVGSGCTTALPTPMRAALNPSPPPRISPAPGSSNVCLDTPLSITFDTTPTLGTAGKIRILKSADHKAVAEIDAANDVAQKAVGSRPGTMNYYPLFVHGREVLLDFGNRTLEPDTLYEVQIDPGVITGGGAPAGLEHWSFTTRKAAPAVGAMIRVDPAGQGDFCTLQGAIDAIPENNTEPRTIKLAPGRYWEQVIIWNKPHLAIAGAGDTVTTISYPNNNVLAGAGVDQRCMLGIYSNDVSLRDLALNNTTRVGGSQAEALRVKADRVSATHCTFRSYQDTLMLEGRVYISDSYVTGDVDYVWGGGTVFFENCEFHSMRRGYLVQSRLREGPSDPADGPYGYVFSHCRITAEPKVDRIWLNRIDTNAYPFSAVAFLNCAMCSAVPPMGWMTGRGNPMLPAPLAAFWEYNSTDLNGKPFDVSQRLKDSKQLTAAEAAMVADPARVLGGSDHWDPRKN